MSSVDAFSDFWVPGLSSVGLYLANNRSLLVPFPIMLKAKVPTSFGSGVLVVDRVLWYTSQETGFIDENVHKSRHNENYNRIFPKTQLTPWP